MSLFVGDGEPMRDGMTAALRISLDERRTRLVELVTVLGGCEPCRAQRMLADRGPGGNVDLTVDPEAFGGCDDPWSDVALALVALRQAAL